MIRKIILILVIAVSSAVIADYYGVITLPSLERPTALDSRDQIVHKTKGVLEDE